jgi:hypothetical protein
MATASMVVPRLLTGSPGGSHIIAYTAQSIWNNMQFGLDPQQAINTPHYMNNNGNTELEDPTSAPELTDYDTSALLEELQTTFGHAGISVSSGLTNGVAVIEITDDEWIGGADPRRDGAVGPTDGEACPSSSPPMATDGPTAAVIPPGESSSPSTSPTTDESGTHNHKHSFRVGYLIASAVGFFVWLW